MSSIKRQKLSGGGFGYLGRFQRQEFLDQGHNRDRLKDLERELKKRFPHDEKQKKKDVPPKDRGPIFADKDESPRDQEMIDSAKEALEVTARLRGRR